MQFEEALAIARKVGRKEHTESELAEALDFLKTAPREQAEEWMNVCYQEMAYKGEISAEGTDFTERFHLLRPLIEEQANGKVRRMTGFGRWTWVAAAVALAAIVYFGDLIFRKQSDHVNPNSVIAGIEPGKEGAILTLSDGRTIVLDEFGNGTITTEQGTSVIVAGNQLVYNASNPAELNNSNSTVAFNTMATPRGRQFSLKLPDGTQVWLNAASSIRYPVSFNGKERIVTVSGEAYFEVASMMDGATSSKVPFIVEIASDAGKIAGRVEVLGTHFNVNSYSDEDNIKTTLVEGKVRVVAAYSDQPAELSPGEQAVMSRPQQGKSQELYKVKAKVDQVIAWKDGVFDFQDASLREVMRQLARWYDLEVVYENDPEMYFVGKMSRKMRLPNLLKALDKSGVKFRLEDNRKLIVQ